MAPLAKYFPDLVAFKDYIQARTKIYQILQTQ